MVPARVSWLDWTFDPVVLLALALAGGVYLWAIGPGRIRFAGAGPVPPGRSLSYFAGLGVVFIALASPLEILGDQYLLTAHMLQHLLLVLVAPPLVLYGLPGWLADRIVPAGRGARLLRRLTHPVPAFLIFNGVFGLWHVPAFYQAALGNPPVHRLEHVSIVVAAVIGWLPVISPFAALPAQSYPIRMLYLFFNVFPSQVIGAILSLADGVLYPVYAIAPRAWGMTPLVDQQVAGLVMWVGGGFYYFGAISIVFFLWSFQQQAADRAAARVRPRAAARTAGDIYERRPR